jgi:uncharacterized phage protein gp47/JayE
MASQQQIINNIINDLRFKVPSMSLIEGTPERRIIEAVAQAIAENQIDLNILNGGLDIDAKVGSDLDNMLGLFGFGRQVGTKASGFLKLSRNTNADAPLRIPAGTQFLAKAANNGSDVIFISNRSVIMAAGTKDVIVPIECIESGEKGNVPANTITDWNGAAINSIISINNEAPIVGGTNKESDDNLKARFTATGPFRNLAGTRDSYLALALSTLSKKATIIGPSSKYTEYIQVPELPDDNGGNSSALNYTTALSTNTNAKFIYDNLPYHVSDDTTSLITIYTQDADFVMNTSPSAKNKGDAYREYVNGINLDPLSTSAPTIYQPNVTFTNVYTGDQKNIQTVSPKDVLFFEYSYLSSASRNDYLRGISNCVDIYVDNSDPVLANVEMARPGNYIPVKTFVQDDKTNYLYYQNFRRKNDNQSCPVPGHIYTPILNQPLVELPNMISTANGTFIKNVHYWEVEDFTDLKGTIRARDGIEWATKIRAMSSGDSETGPYSGQYITDSAAVTGLLTLGISTSADAVGGIGTIIKFNESILFPDFGKLMIDNEQISYQKIVDTPTPANSGWMPFLSSDPASGTDQYIWFGSTAALQKYGTTTLSANLLSSITTGGSISVTANINLPQPVDTNGSHPFVVLIDEELISYKTTSTTTINGVTYITGLTILARGVNGTTISDHKSGATVSSFVCYKDSAYRCKTSYTYNTGSSTVPYPTTPDLDNYYWEKIGNRLRFDARGDNSTTAVSHLAKSNIQTLFDTTEQILSIENYTYNGNIVTLQARVDDAKQITTDALVHEATTRYFKPDITVMYDKGQNPTTVNNNIVNSLKFYFDNQYFGSTIQLSDILQIIHNTSGVDNVKWSKDNLVASVDSAGDPRNRLTEVNKYGNSAKYSLQKISIGEGDLGGTQATSYLFYLTDENSSGKLQFNYNNNDIFVTLDANLNASVLNSKLSSFASVSAVNSNAKPTIDNPYTITYSKTNDVNELTIVNPELIIETKKTFNNDFLLGDNQLTSLALLQDASTDISQIITIRVKAQNTWNKV